VELDVRVGGRYRITMYNPENDNRPVVGGVYEEVEPGSKLVFTWRWENNPAWSDDSRVTVTLSEADCGTVLRLRHERLPNEKERESHVKGWSACIEQLEEEL
ncbi:MAG: SRPBCC domain-containing protein, partial [Candidatus Hydrogenedentes bacterium]|nr:SRPBCC domain-containing protein [Candidatus Hydrogenedentota bacterium]